MSLQPSQAGGPFQSYIAASAFLHDDWNPSAGLKDWGQYDTNPFLLGAPVCVVSTLAGFGPEYIDYLRRLDSYPEVVIVPSGDAHDLTAKLLADPASRERLQSEMHTRRLGLSLFYPHRFIDELTALCASVNGGAPLSPVPGVFNEANLKLNMHGIFERAGIEVPEYAVCSTPAEVRQFVRSPRAFPDVLLKSGHRTTLHLTQDNLEVSLQALSLPAVAETCYPHRRSPSANLFAGPNGVQVLFATAQYISGLMNWGNDSAAHLTPDLRTAVIERTRRVAGCLTGINGVVGVDYIETLDGRLLAVDLNPRFCSPTYPFTFLQRMGIGLELSFARYRVVPCSLLSLSDLLSHPDYLPLEPGCPEGMFVFNPVVYDTPRPVNYLSYIVFSENPTQLDILERTLQRILA